jgi:hypothetical protein
MHLMPLVNAAGRLGVPRGKWHSRSPKLHSGTETSRTGVPEYSFAETRWEDS